MRMGGKRFTKAEEQLRPDPRYGDRVLSRFINCVMREGKKSVAQRIVYESFDIIQGRLAKETDPNAPKEALEVFHRAVENVKPFVEVRSKRIGGANYQVPMQVNRKRQMSLAFRWILEAARSEKGRPMAQRLADELYNAARGEGKAMATRDQTHRMAEANRAFAHFAN
jgi:small subunit ribosomal protein S7